MERASQGVQVHVVVDMLGQVTAQIVVAGACPLQTVQFDVRLDEAYRLGVLVVHHELRLGPAFVEYADAARSRGRHGVESVPAVHAGRLEE